MIKKVNLLVILLLASSCLLAQKQLERNTKINLPDIPGYITLKGDFHMHTVFSDGHVWPSFRVKEAQRDGLDIISITEHMDYEGYPDEVEHDLEKAYSIAQEVAEKTNVVVIRGVEISPRVPPYHNNAIFLKDVNSFPFDYMKQTHKKFVMKDNIRGKDLLAPFLEVEKQNGFVFYNHPSYNWWDQKDKELFTSIHHTLLEKGILGGVEVVNGGRYNLIAHRMAEKYNLTMFANSDAHHAVSNNGEHRPITLVFARSKQLEDIEEAIRDRRTAVYHKDMLIGRIREMEPLFKNSLEITTEKITGKKSPQLKLIIKNTSDIPYEVQITSEYIIENTPLGKSTLEAHETTTFLMNPVWEYPEILKLSFQVENVLVSPDKVLDTSVEVEL